VYSKICLSLQHSNFEDGKKFKVDVVRGTLPTTQRKSFLFKIAKIKTCKTTVLPATLNKECET
jgi:hypothetical protein